MESTMKTEAARTVPAAQSAAQQSAARPAAQQPAPQPAAQPVRRIGSITLGVALHSRTDTSPAVKMFLRYAVRMLTKKED